MASDVVINLGFQATAWSESEMGRRVNNGGLPKPFFLNGNSAFKPGKEWMATPGGTDACDFVPCGCRLSARLASLS